MEIQQAGKNATIIEDYPEDKYSPSCLLSGFTTEGRPLHMQVTRMETSSDKIKIITLYQPNAREWVNYTKRR